MSQEWDGTRQMYVVTVSERYSPAVSVVGPFTKPEADAWVIQKMTMVGAFGKGWEWNVRRVSDPQEEWGG